MKKISHIEESVVVRLTSKHGCLTTTVKIYTLWERIFDGPKRNHKDISDGNKLFTGEQFPEVPCNISLFANKCQ